MRSQTFKDWEHLVHHDEARTGCSASYNLLGREARGEWVFVLADDDLMLPGCLQTHLDNTDGADIVYGPPLVWGEAPDQFHGSPPWIPASALIRTSWWRRLNGYNEKLPEQEDRDFFQRAFDLSAIFVRVPTEATWVYRLGHGGNKSRHNGVAT